MLHQLLQAIKADGTVTEASASLVAFIICLVPLHRFGLSRVRRRWLRSLASSRVSVPLCGGITSSNLPSWCFNDAFRGGETPLCGFQHPYASPGRSVFPMKFINAPREVALA